MTNETFAGIVGALAGTAAGFFLSWIKERCDRRERLRAQKAAMLAEVEECKKIGQTYLDASIASPLYRAPTLVYESALPGLLVDSGIDANAVAAIIEFYGMVETINRGLDEADRIRTGQHSPGESTEGALAQAYVRNCIKAKSLVNDLHAKAAAALRD